MVANSILHQGSARPGLANKVSDRWKWLTLEQLEAKTPLTIINEEPKAETALEKARRRWFTEREGANAR
jgi:hypothetical protein